MRSSRDRWSRHAGTSPRPTGRNTRALGTNPRALGTNPRALGEHPSAGNVRDRGRVATNRATALAVLRAAGLTWCGRCGDGGSVPAAGEPDRWVPCSCEPIPSERAARIAERFGHHVADGGRSFLLEAPGVADRLMRMLFAPP